MTIAAINATALKSFIARIERLEAEKVAIAADIKSIYDEAKASGYSAKIMRQVVKRRAQDPNKLAQQEAELELYADAVGFGSLPLGKIIAAVESAGPRVSDVKAKLAEDESVDPETGEIIDSQANPTDDATVTELDGPAASAQAKAKGADGAEVGSRLDARRSTSTTSEHGRDRAERRPPPDDDLELPACLDRRDKVLEHA